MQGNHRVRGAQWDGLRSIGIILYTPDEWEAFIGWPFNRWGTDNPGLIP
jgi:hypothetical protein